MFCRMRKMWVQQASEHGLVPVSERVAINRKLWLIASCTQFAIELRWISIVRLIATLCETGPWGPSPKRCPIQYGRPNYIGAYLRTKCTSQNSSCTYNRVIAYRGYLTHKPITARHLLLTDASAYGLAYGFAVRYLLNVGYGPMRYPYFHT